MKTCVSSKRGSACARLSVFALAMSGAFLAQAQNLTAQLSPVVVTANRVATPLVDVLADVTLIDRATLDRAGQSSLRDVLAQQPGVQLVSNGGYFSSSGVFLRGASSSQNIVLVDGVRVGSATSGGSTAGHSGCTRTRKEGRYRLFD